MSLVEFLKARLAEDEAVLLSRLWPFGSYIPEFSPARLYDEIQDKKGIIEELEDYEDGWTWDTGTSWRAEFVLRYLARPYSRHPDYKKEWKL